jgi:SAM-dependent methyltransferase
MSQSKGRDGGWGAAARDWAALQEGSQRPVFERVLARAGIGQGSAVLDVACGTGLFLLLAQERGAAVAGLDASAGQLAVARERLPDGDLREGEMDALPFEDGRFDLASCSLALQYATDAVQALREMRRVGKPGASVAIITPPLTGARGSGVTFEALAPFRAQGQAAPTDPVTPARAIFREPGTLERFMAEAGLAIYDDGVVATDWDYPDLDSALRGVLSYAPGVRAIRTAGVEAVHAAVAPALEPFRTASGGYHLPNQSRYVLARAQ